MAALPYIPLFVADYLADTRHLTAAQHGAYLLLIFNYWQTGKPLPNDDAKLARIACMNKRDWAHNRDAILEFFSIQENTLVHSRIQAELSRVEAKSLKSKKAAQASVQRRFGERSADAQRTLNHTQAHTDKSIPLDKSNGGNPEPEDDPSARFWRDAKAWLKPRVKGDPGALVNKWMREHGKDMTQAAINAAQVQNAVDPPAYIAGYFRRHASEQAAPVWDGMP